MVDVPMQFLDFSFDSIEEYMCPAVFFAINVLLNIIGKPLDVFDVVC